MEEDGILYYIPLEGISRPYSYIHSVSLNNINICEFLTESMLHSDAFEYNKEVDNVVNKKFLKLNSKNTFTIYKVGYGVNGFLSLVGSIVKEWQKSTKGWKLMY